MSRLLLAVVMVWSCVRESVCFTMNQAQGVFEMVQTMHVRHPAATMVELDALEAIQHTATEAAKRASKIIAAKIGADVISTKAGAKDLLTAVDGECQQVIESVVAAAHPSGHDFLGEESVPAGAKASAEALTAAMSGSDADWLWIVDPIDGTTNFVQSLPILGVSIGVAHRGEDGTWQLAVGVIADPFRDEIFAACAGGGAYLDGARIYVGDETLSNAVVSTGFAPNERSLRPMVRGIAAVGARARTVRMLGSAAIMLAWVACGRLSAYFEADLNAWDTAAGALLVREAGGVVTDLQGEPFTIATRPMLASNPAAHAELVSTLTEAGVRGLDE